MKALNKFLVVLCVGLFACNDQPIEPEVIDPIVEEPTEVVSEPNNGFDQIGPVTECSETLSAVELREKWEMMNPGPHHETTVCFTGYVFSNETYGDLIQGSIAFKPFTGEESVIPTIYCQFTGNNGIEFENYEKGEKIEIMGKMLKIDNSDRHNIMMVKCSLPDRDGK